MIFKTQSGSVYEVNQTAKQIRRLQGMVDPTPRQGSDGEWRSYEGITHPRVGEVVAIAWNSKTTPLMPGSPDDAQPMTLTSVVVEIQY